MTRTCMQQITSTRHGGHSFDDRTISLKYIQAEYKAKKKNRATRKGLSGLWFFVNLKVVAVKINLLCN